MEPHPRAWPPRDVVGSEALTRKVQGHGKDMLAWRGRSSSSTAASEGGGGAWQGLGEGAGVVHVVRRKGGSRGELCGWGGLEVHVV